MNLPNYMPMTLVAVAGDDYILVNRGQSMNPVRLNVHGTTKELMKHLGKDIWVLYQPHSSTRTEGTLLDWYRV